MHVSLGNAGLTNRKQKINNMSVQYKPVQLMSVKEWLDREKAENLKQFARLLGADKKIIRKPQLISLISGHLTGYRLRERRSGISPARSMNCGAST